jgi:hypothetical protein
VEKNRNIVEESGMFFVSKKRPSTHHVSPRISPQSHHKNTTFCAHFFQNLPQKHQQNNKTPARARVSFFSEINSD